MVQRVLSFLFHSHSLSVAVLEWHNQKIDNTHPADLICRCQVRGTQGYEQNKPWINIFNFQSFTGCMRVRTEHYCTAFSTE